MLNKLVLWLATKLLTKKNLLDLFIDSLVNIDSEVSPDDVSRLQKYCLKTTLSKNTPKELGVLSTLLVIANNITSATSEEQAGVMENFLARVNEVKATSHHMKVKGELIKLIKLHLTMPMDDEDVKFIAEQLINNTIYPEIISKILKEII